MPVSLTAAAAGLSLSHVQTPSPWPGSAASAVRGRLPPISRVQSPSAMARPASFGMGVSSAFFALPSLSCVSSPLSAPLAVRRKDAFRIRVFAAMELARTESSRVVQHRATVPFEPL